VLYNITLNGIDSQVETKISYHGSKHDCRINKNKEMVGLDLCHDEIFVRIKFSSKLGLRKSSIIWPIKLTFVLRVYNSFFF
jgi:hypothetical protein